MEIRGELSLSFQDVCNINKEISSSGFQFQELSSVVRTISKPTNMSYRKLKTELDLNKHDSIVSLKSESYDHMVSPVRSRRAIKAPLKYEESGSEDSGSSFSKSKRIKGLTNDKWTIQKGGSKYISRIGQPRGMKRREPSKGEMMWRNACLKILQSQKRQPYSSLFMHRSFNASQQINIDLEMIESNLQSGKYTNPYWWQHDMRQLCFNIFVNSMPDQEIWQQSKQFIIDFENQCKEITRANPYYKFNTIEVEPKVKTIPQRVIHRNIKKIEQVFYSSDESNYSDLDNCKVSRSNFAQEKKKRPVRSPAKKTSAPKKSPSIMDSPPRYSFYQVAPEFGPILDPPGIQKISSNDRPLNSSQRRTLEHNMSLLAPNQRKVVLELIQDDLGILAESHMHDKKFTFDIELISIEKQKRVFMYVNKLIRANLEMIQGSKGHGKREHENSFSQDFLKLKSDNKLSKPSEIFDSSSSSSFSLSDSDKDAFEDSANCSISFSQTKQPSSTTSIGISNIYNTIDANNSHKIDPFNNFYDNSGDSQLNMLPEYSPVTDEREKLHIGDIVGKSPGFFGSIQNFQPIPTSAPSTSSAWPEWKGQVIQQGLVSQNGVPPRSADERIAEGFDARI
ncbi:bromodomain protein, putative [Babesia microti strain RI]|uniref:Bromodomain protein, putative n=1 Tax=Babesia microti (strain RI) TaxID=1133968 RepID=A0A1R4A9Y4_BABMR|nr:bromodomain protein, putative [Babesia microti strain RI]SJK85812.1 bromodomain protein, putative [Babesia microti strain RI]|eukprot:XP_021338031.1 bromodomain protein, putative [Babesia microti strain RI]